MSQSLEKRLLAYGGGTALTLLFAIGAFLGNEVWAKTTENTNTITVCKERLSILESQFATIKESVGEIKADVKEILHSVKENQK